MGLCLLTVWRYFECFVGARVRYVRVLTIDDHVIQLDRTEGRTDGRTLLSFIFLALENGQKSSSQFPNVLPSVR